MSGTDSAAVTRELTDELPRADRLPDGFEGAEAIRDAVLALPELAWRAAIRQDGEDRRERVGGPTAST